MQQMQRFSSLLLLAFFMGINGCGESDPDRETLTVADEEAERISSERTGELSPGLADGLEVTLWASETLVRDPVALHADDTGRVWVTSTGRRRNAELDIRSHQGWMVESAGFETVEDRREFLHRELAPERSGENTWLEDYNGDGSRDWRDLLVPQESVYRLEDLSGNGFANRSQLFHKGFNEEISDVAGAVLQHEGDLFVGVAPDLWRIRDVDQDGYGEQKESISHGYGVNIGFGGHGMSGLTTGPDGRIYWSIGDRGMSVTEREGNRWHHPRDGVIVRSEPDGTDFEVFASGLRNTHEFVFDKYGNLITVDNDGDHAGEFERLVYLVNGSDSGWRVNWQYGKYDDPKNNSYNVLMEESYFRPRFDGQAAHLLPPLSRFHNGPTGMAYNPGTALSEEWKDHFFIAEFVGSASGSGIHAFTLRESGASFELDRDEKIMGGLLATGLSFGPDGALYFADWIEGWALNGEGRIWKMDTPDAANSAAREETRELLGSDFSGREAEELLGLLSHEDMRVRQKAQFELVARGDRETLEEALALTNGQLGRIHGIWGLAQLGRQEPDAVRPLLSLLQDSDSEIRAQAAKMLGDNRYEPAADALIPLLQDENARVRFFAAEALGRIGWRPAFDPIVKMLEVNNEEDVYLRHVGAIALERIGDEDALAGLSEHPSRAVRIAAVVALKRLESSGVVRFLNDRDEFVVTNAARAINDDRFIDEGLEALAGMTEQSRFLNEPLLRRAINANLYTGTPEAAERLARFSLRSDVPEELRAEALRTLAVWEESSELDRVTGDPRGVVRNEPQEARDALSLVIRDILNGSDLTVQLAALEAAGTLQYTPAVPRIRDMVRRGLSPNVRMASLQTLIELEADGLDEEILAALEDESETVRMHALERIPGLELPEERIVDLLNTVLESGTVSEQQAAILSLVNVASSVAEERLAELVERLRAGGLPRELELETVQAAERAGSELLQEALSLYNAEKAAGDSVSAYREALYGGSAERGRGIFYRSAAAQCIRCHVVDGEGSTVGPDLTGVGERLSREELLESMIDPNARITPGYGSVTLTVENGETIRGLLTGESEAELTIIRDGEEMTVETSRITEREYSPSGMPAMGTLLSRSELRDLVEYLTTLQAGG
ncbi:MAG: HEAT repeat domain-containing protein [Balneolaceae bacterium]